MLGKYLKLGQLLALTFPFHYSPITHHSTQLKASLNNSGEKNEITSSLKG
jgi:hypothetical protein